MSNSFWTRTAAAITMAALPVGLYYLMQHVPEFGSGLNLLALVVLLFGAILGVIAWVGQNSDFEPVSVD